MTPTAIFLVNLVQDVAVLRPLVVMATRDMGYSARILVSPQFEGRDRQNVWMKELELLVRDSGAALHFYADALAAFSLMEGGGILFSASESHLPNHRETHELMRLAPATFLRVTLQHGFECVGFRHSAEHSAAHGPSARFAADMLAGWAPASHLPSLAPCEAGKLVASGPTSNLQRIRPDRRGMRDILVCENLHSVRFRAAKQAVSEFPAMFARFCLAMQDAGRSVVLRPHPGGQFSARKKLPLGRNARLDFGPIYRGGLDGIGCAISAPSSVVIDLLMAGVPTALWVPPEGEIDISGFEGLPVVYSIDDWTDFVSRAEQDADTLIARQDAFLEGAGIIVDPETTYRRFAEMFASAKRYAEAMSAS